MTLDRPQLREIVRLACELAECTTYEMLGDGRDRHIAYYRQAAMRAAVQFGYSSGVVGAHFNRDGSTARTARKAVLSRPRQLKLACAIAEIARTMEPTPARPSPRRRAAKSENQRFWERWADECRRRGEDEISGRTIEDSRKMYANNW